MKHVKYLNITLNHNFYEWWNIYTFYLIANNMQTSQNITFSLH